MEYGSFCELMKRAQGLPTRRGVVAGAEDEHILEAVFAAKRKGIMLPLLAGDGGRVKALAKSLGFATSECEILDVPIGENPADRAVEAIVAGKADFLIKGLLDTKDLLKPVVDRKNGLHMENRLMSHVALLQIPGERKLVAVTDGGMVVYPDLEMKKSIILNAVETLRKMGYEKPKVAVLCAVEKLNEKIRETVDAHELAEANQRGELPDCVVAGPISYDVAMRADIAKLKGYDGSPHCGDFDVLVTSDMTAGNLLGKSLIVSASAKMAGVIVGAKTPIVVTSRGSSAEEKFNSIVFCAVTS
ncbi:MAG: phosphate butyryltransferase [Synergistaceae bacterium]|jgi:phosphate butyryltransferase|nr:phosphate butyryltransferase [Synergistaceae bacterium]